MATRRPGPAAVWSTSLSGARATSRASPLLAPVTSWNAKEKQLVMKRISIAVCLFVVACGGEQDGGEPTPEPVAWKDMSFEQRYEYMEDIVLPEMKKTFVAFDAKFENMSCATCHGDGAVNGTYAMPSPQIPVLPGTEKAFIEYAKDPEIGRWSTWMYEKVVPQTADLLQVERYDGNTHTGEFSCYNCHTLDGVEE